MAVEKDLTLDDVLAWVMKTRQDVHPYTKRTGSAAEVLFKAVEHYSGIARIMGTSYDETRMQGAAEYARLAAWLQELYVYRYQTKTEGPKPPLQRNPTGPQHKVVKKEN